MRFGPILSAFVLGAVIAAAGCSSLGVKSESSEQALGAASVATVYYELASQGFVAHYDNRSPYVASITINHPSNVDGCTVYPIIARLRWRASEVFHGRAMVFFVADGSDVVATVGGLEFDTEMKVRDDGSLVVEGWLPVRMHSLESLRQLARLERGNRPSHIWKAEAAIEAVRERILKAQFNGEIIEGEGGAQWLPGNELMESGVSEYDDVVVIDDASWHVDVWTLAQRAPGTSLRIIWRVYGRSDSLEPTRALPVRDLGKEAASGS